MIKLELGEINIFKFKLFSTLKIIIFLLYYSLECNLNYILGLNVIFKVQGFICKNIQTLTFF